jgi:murein DD-endopeptidase MepM/ murein hydrolase activator NlpD
VDFAAPEGTPVYAAAAGVVVFEGYGHNDPWSLAPAGICARIRHLKSHTGYAHLSRTVINKWQPVRKGQLIGYSGNTGQSTGPHLHWEKLPIKPNFKNGYAGRIDPMKSVRR